jgi:hypothetical protein
VIDVIKKTTNNEVFKKYSLIVAINNKKCISSELYQNGAVNAERFNEFLKNICSKVKGSLIYQENFVFPIKIEIIILSLNK